MVRTSMGYLIVDLGSILWLLMSSAYWRVYFLGMKVLGLAMVVYRFLHHALQLLSRTTQAIVSATFIYPPKLAALTSTTWCEYLCPAVRSTLWWSVTILMSPFILTVAILETLEDGVWLHLQKLFWNIAKLSTSDAFKFHRMLILSKVVASLRLEISSRASKLVRAIFSATPYCPLSIAYHVPLYTTVAHT
jgi:hypothetical protein